MARHKSFGGGKSIDDFEALGFDIAGSSFSCRPAVPGSALLEFIKDADDEDGAGSARALYTFLQRAMSEGEYIRLKDVLDSPDTIIDISEIAEIVTWLIGEYSDRPTKPSENSGDGQ